jgi:holo-[acyl-carrier protein] synthase
MIVGMGVDIVEVPRVRSAIERFGERFINRLFTQAEIRYCESKANKYERFAARFAAKEAALKALGTGLSRGISWQDVEVVREPSGRPTLAIRGKAAEFAKRLGVQRSTVSLSHTEQVAFAQVILED